MIPVNPMNIVSLIKQGQNPEQIMLGLLKQQAPNSPLGQNLLMLAQQGNTAEIERIARNLAKEKGLDYDKEFNAFKQQLGLK